MFNNNNNYNSQGVPSFMAYGGVPVGLPKGAVLQNATGGAVPQWALDHKIQTSLSNNHLNWLRITRRQMFYLIYFLMI